MHEMKNDYLIYSTNQDLGSLQKNEINYIVSLDPAMKNFAVGIEERKWGEKGSSIALFKFAVRTIATDRCQSFCLDFIKEMDECAEWWPHIHLVILENQMKVNSNASRIAQHALTYFLFRCPNAIVVEINPKLKGRILGAPKLKYSELKKWSIGEARKILAERNDAFGLGKLRKGKLDDLADVICETEAFMEYLGELFHPRR
jgi:hypothetical protein